jgi:regulation of enolase protein 1 (concanavalin A-like superfamily)
MIKSRSVRWVKHGVEHSGEMRNTHYVVVLKFGSDWFGIVDAHGRIILKLMIKK